GRGSVRLRSSGPKRPALHLKLGSAAAEDIRQAVVVLVARVFVNRLVEQGQRELTAPWPRIQLVVFDGKAIKQLGRRYASEPLGHLAAPAQEQRSARDVSGRIVGAQV